MKGEKGKLYVEWRLVMRTEIKGMKMRNSYKLRGLRGKQSRRGRGKRFLIRCFSSGRREII